MHKNINGINVTAPTEAFDLSKILAKRKENRMIQFVEIKFNFLQILKKLNNIFRNKFK